MESLDYWRLCEELTVKQAALLIVGEDPSATAQYVEEWEMHKRPVGYEAAKSLLVNSIVSGLIDARGEDWGSYNFDWGETPGKLLIDQTIIKVHSIIGLLKLRGLTTGFFFPSDLNQTPDYLDNKSPNYSPKLAAAIEAWLAVAGNPELTKGKSVKQGILVWLRSHAGRFGLIKEDGNPNESGIEEVAKVANWETKGGAPRTPEA